MLITTHKPYYKNNPLKLHQARWKLRKIERQTYCFPLGGRCRTWKVHKEFANTYARDFKKYYINILIYSHTNP